MFCPLIICLQKNFLICSPDIFVILSATLIIRISSLLPCLSGLLILVFANIFVLWLLHLIMPSFVVFLCPNLSSGCQCLCDVSPAVTFLWPMTHYFTGRQIDCVQVCVPWAHFYMFQKSYYECGYYVMVNSINCCQQDTVSHLWHDLTWPVELHVTGS